MGIWRLSDQEIAARQRTWFRWERATITQWCQAADVVNVEELDSNEHARFAIDSVIRELARDALSKVTQRRIEKVARGTSNDLPAFSAVEWMITLSPRRSGAKNA
jgi:hypothetical protein